MNVQRMDRSLGELFADLSHQIGDLISQEARLAKAELGEKLSGVGGHAAMLGGAAVIALAAVMSVAAAVTLGMIDLGVRPWLAAGITAALMGLVAYVMAQSGLTALRKTSITPEKTIHSLKETTQWLKHPSTR